jgi:uncharacterized protein
MRGFWDHTPTELQIIGKHMNSPCIKICKLNEEDICIGCGRTKKDITDWRSMTDEERSEAIKKAIEKVFGKDKTPP